MAGDDYDQGGFLQPGLLLATNASDQAEPVLTIEQWREVGGED
ncbi:hypothetical protein [Streptomyces sp. NPDC020377]